MVWVPSEFLRSPQGHQGNVVLLLPALPDERVKFLHQEVCQRSFLSSTLRDQPPQPRNAEHLAFGIMGLDEAVTVEEGGIAGLQHSLLLLIARTRHEPQRHPPRPQLLGLAVMSPAWEALSGVGVEKASALGVEDAIEAGDERARGYLRDQRLVDPCQNLPRRLHRLNDSPKHAAGRGHHQCRRHALACGVSHDEAYPAIFELKEVVEVSSYLP